MKALIQIAMIAAVVGFGLVGTSLAHEGHTHTVMGVVWKIGADQVEVKVKDGKTETIRVTDTTSVSRGKELASFASLKPGERVVVDVGTGKKPLTARSIKVGVSEPAKKSS